MTVKEYAAMLNISTVAVTKRLKLNNPPKYITSYRKFGNTYDLEVDVVGLSTLIAKGKVKPVALNKN